MLVSIPRLSYSLFFIFCLKPIGLNYYDTIDTIINMTKIVMVVYFCVYFIYCFFYGKNHHFVCTYIIFFMYLAVLVPTIVNHGDYFSRIMEMLSTLMLSVFFEKNKSNISEILVSWFVVISIYVTLNIVSVIAGGVAYNESLAIYFLGSKNSFGSLLPLYFFIIYYYYQLNSKHKFFPGVVFFILVVNVVITLSTTAIVELVLLFIILVIKEVNFIKKITGYWSLLFIYSIANIILLSSFFWNIASIYLDTYFLKGAFSFLARTRMWQTGISLFLEHPFWGNGKLKEDVWSNYFYDVSFHTQLHNQVVEYLSTGGVVLFGIYCILLFVTGLNLNKYHSDKIGGMLIVSIFLQNIGVLTEAKYFAEFFLLFILSFYAKYFISKKNT